MLFQAVQNEINRSPKSWAAAKTAFISCFVAGYAVHLFAFANLIPNSDGLSRMADPQQTTIFGRWFLHYATLWNGYVQSPGLIGLLSVLFMALAAALVVRTLRMEECHLAGLLGVLWIVFPPVAYTYLYMYTASAYFFGVLLAVTSVWMTARSRYGWIPGALLLACAVGTYQAYLAVAVSLSFLCVILDALRKESSLRDILGTGLRHLALLMSGLILYLGILRIFLAVKGITLIAYHGISDMGTRMRPDVLLSQILPVYRRFLSYFLNPSGICGYANAFSAILNVLVAVFGLVFAAVCIRRVLQQKRRGEAALTTLLILLAPLAFNLAAFMDDDKEIMRYGLIFAYLFVLALAEPAVGRPAAGGRGRAVCTGLLLGVFAALVLFFANVDNRAYTAVATAHRATEAFAVNLVGRVESLPGYQNGMEVVIIGPFPEEVYHSGLEVLDLPDAPVDSVMPLGKHVYYYLNDWLNVPWPEPSQETLLAVSESEAFRAMPLYPDDGSVAILDGRVVVRLTDQYRPKQPYEIQYEDRR